MLEEMLPQAIEAGILERDFRHMTLGAIRLHIDQYWKRRKDEYEMLEQQAWNIGYFVMYSIGSNFSKKISYPQNPLANRKKTLDELSKEFGKTKEELLQEEQYFNMRVKQANANIDKVKKDRKKSEIRADEV